MILIRNWERALGLPSIISRYSRRPLLKPWETCTCICIEVGCIKRLNRETIIEYIFDIYGLCCSVVGGLLLKFSKNVCQEKTQVDYSSLLQSFYSKHISVYIF